jgi:ferritin
VDLARAENDHAAEVFLAWFVTEQVEEEANASQIVEKLKMIKEQPQGLLMLDAQLAGRE